MFSGKKPWSKGYFEYKWERIERVIRNKGLLTIFQKRESLPSGYGVGIDERIVEFPWILSQLPSWSGTLLDAGSALNFFSLITHPKLKTKKVSIMTLAPETNNYARYGVSYVYGDIRRLPFQNEWFDIITCISTLEHIGLDNATLYTHERIHQEQDPEAYLKALQELYRVIKIGGRIYITVPFGTYENIGFMQQFTSQMIDRMLAVCPWQDSSVAYYQYTNNGWNISSREMSQSARYFNIHSKAEVESDRAAAARAVACLTLTK